MGRVQLKKSDLPTDEISLIRTFIQAAYRQGYDTDWVDAVIAAALASNWADFWTIMQAHIEIIPPQHPSQQSEV